MKMAVLFPRLRVGVAAAILTLAACLLHPIECSTASSAASIISSSSGSKPSLSGAKTVCGTQFTDIPSKVYLADIVFQGTVVRLVPTRVRDPNVTVSTNDVIFKIANVSKGSALLKNAHRQYVQVGVFRDEPRAGQCIGSVAVNASYFVYVRLDKQGRAHSYRITAFPDLDTKVTRQLVKNSVCENCVRAPRVTITQPATSEVTVTVGRRLKVECEAVGQPQPLLHWHFNDRPLLRSQSISIRPTRKGSRLTIKHVTGDHEGRYTCVATSVVGVSSAHVDVTTRTQPTSPPTTAPSSTQECFGHYCLCPEQTYCLNGGTCYQMLTIKTQFCRCANDYIGNRCQEKISAGFDLARLAKTDIADVRWSPESDAEFEFLRWLERRDKRVASRQ